MKYVVEWFGNQRLQSTLSPSFVDLNAESCHAEYDTFPGDGKFDGNVDCDFKENHVCYNITQNTKSEGDMVGQYCFHPVMRNESALLKNLAAFATFFSFITSPANWIRY